MMKMALLKTYYKPEEAYSVLMLLDELRDTIWNNYREDIIDYASKQESEPDPQTKIKEHDDSQISFDFDDDIIPF